MSDIGMTTLFQDFMGDLTMKSGSGSYSSIDRISAQTVRTQNSSQNSHGTIPSYVNDKEQVSIAKVEPIFEDFDNEEQLIGAHKFFHRLQERGLLPKSDINWGSNRVEEELGRHPQRVLDVVHELDTRFDEKEEANSNWVPVEEAAQIVGVQPGSVYRAARKGRIEIKERVRPVEYTRVSKYVHLPSLIDYNQNSSKGGRPRKDSST